MRITFLLPSLDLGGGIRVASIHARALQRRGHKVVAVVPPPGAKSWGARVRALLDPEAPRRAAMLSRPPSHFDGSGVELRVAALPDDSTAVADRTEWFHALRASGRVFATVDAALDAAPS